MAKPLFSFSGCLKRAARLGAVAALGACSLVQYQPTQTIGSVRTDEGYRLEREFDRSSEDGTLVIMVFSGGGTRAAALGYGVLETFNRYPVMLGGRRTTLTAAADIAYGVSGGSVLAMYYALHGEAAVPRFESRFLKQNFQRLILKQTLSFANMPRLASPEFGRGDLLQEQFENTLFGHITFGDLVRGRKGPFAVISATDMASGQRLDYTQENFDRLCLNLSDLRVARAVASSSAVPMLFAPLTLNNNSGNCGYTLPKRIRFAINQGEKHDDLQQQTRKELVANTFYADSKARPYLHLVDGGLTDNLGLQHLLEMRDIYPNSSLEAQIADRDIRRVIIISVNAKNNPSDTISTTAAVPSFRSMLNAVVDIPIAQRSQETLRRFRKLTDNWNAAQKNAEKPVPMHFVSLNLHDLPPSDFRTRVLNIPTTYYLPPASIDDLKRAARLLVEQSGEFRQLMKEIGVGQPENTAAQ